MNPFFRNYIFFSIVAISICAVFYNSLFYNFTHWDDFEQIVENRNIYELSTSSLASIFSSTSVGMYQPFTTLIYSFCYYISGSNPLSYHITSLLFHFLNCILVFKLLKNYSSNWKLTSLLTLIFAFHPMQVESIAWASAMSTLTYTFFGLLSLINYSHFSKNSERKNYLMALSFFILACLSKSAAVFIPIILLFIEVYENTKWSRIIKKLIPFFIVSLAFGLVTIFSRQSAGHLSDISQSFSALERIFLIGYSYLFYAIKFFVPVNLSAFYAFPSSTENLPFYFYISPIIVLGILYLIWKSRKNKDVLIPFSIYSFGLFLVLQIVPVGSQIVADRYIYFPMIGLLLLLAFFMENRKIKIHFTLFVIPFLLAFNSQKRTSIWENDETLWTDVIKKNSMVPQAYNNLASFEIEKGNLKKALKLVEQALKIRPNYADALSNRGNIYSQSGEIDKALFDFKEALRLKKEANTYFNRANLYAKIGEAELAIQDFTSSINIKESADAYTNRAYSRLQLKDESQAIQDLQIAIQINPNFSPALYLNGMVLIKQKHFEEACESLLRASDLDNKKAKEAYNKFCQNN